MVKNRTSKDESEPGNKRFYVAGGTLQPGAPSYVKRSADDQLLDSLLAGEFCYVLNARQMGKSSLMASTAYRLTNAGVKPVLIDLTAIGLNVTLEQWYFGLSAILAGQLDGLLDVPALWEKHAREAPHRRWMLTLEEAGKRQAGPVAVFVDEIDLVKSLPFRTDEFFAGIRELYNTRSAVSQNPSLTFCLLGVATPAELIRDPNTTPFNIGRRVVLSDFTLNEAEILATGFGWGRDGIALLERVFYWTDGHPYLTQRLCRAISEDPGIYDDNGVDSLCASLFLAPEGRDKDDNLLFVRDRLRDHAIPGSQLQRAYLKVLRRRRKQEFLGSGALAAKLILTGAVKLDNGWIRVRNRLYARAFDRRWVLANMPDADLRRIRRAFWRGVVRATLLSCAAFGAIGGLAVYGLNKAHIAQENSAIARAKESQWNSLFYSSTIFSAYRDVVDDPSNLNAANARMLEIAGRVPAMRDIEWSYLWRASNQPAVIYRRPPVAAYWLVAPLDGHLLCVAQNLDDAHCGFDVVDLASGKTLRHVATVAPIWQLETSDLGQIFASVRGAVYEFGGDGSISLRTFRPPRGRPLHSFQITRDGSRIALLTDGGETKRIFRSGVVVFDAHTGSALRELSFPKYIAGLTLLSQSNEILASQDRFLYEASYANHDPPRQVFTSAGAIQVIGRSGDDRRLAVAGSDGYTQILDAQSKRVLADLKVAQTNGLWTNSHATLDQDGSHLLATSEGDLVSDFDVATGRTAVYRTGKDADCCFLDHDQVAIGLQDRVLVWSPGSAPASVNFAPLPTRQSFTGFVGFADSGTSLLANTWWAPTRRWLADTGQALPQAGSRVVEGAYHVRWSAKGVAVSSAAGARLWSDDLGPIDYLQAPAAGNRLLAVDDQDEAVLYDLPSGRRLARLPHVMAACVSSDGSRVAAICYERSQMPGGIRGPNGAWYGRGMAKALLWSAKVGWQMLKPPEGGLDSFGWNCVAFNPTNGNLELIYSFFDSEMRMTFKLESYDPATGRFSLFGDPLGENTPLTALAFTPDGRRLLTGTLDGRVQIRDAEALRVLLEVRRESPRKPGQIPLYPLRPNALEVESIAVSPNGASFAAAFGDGAVTLWRGTSISEADSQIAADQALPHEVGRATHATNTNNA